MRTIRHSSRLLSNPCTIKTHISRPVRLVKAPQSAQTSFSTEEQVASTSSKSVTYTNYECNSFAVNFNKAGVRVLVDPWFVDDLVFGDSPWLFRGKKRMLAKGKMDLQAIAAQTDVILITQSLPDHFHAPTLKLLPKTIPVVTNPDTVGMASSLGFTNVISVDHGQSITIGGGKLQLKATQGALVGPPWSKRQNGFVMREVGMQGGISLYFEPHCDFVASSVAAEAPVDVVVSPVCSQLLNLGVMQYPLVQGDISLVELLQILKPKVLIPLLNAEIDQEGPLADFIIDRGDVAAATRVLKQQGVEVLMQMVPEGGESAVVQA